MSSKQSNMKIAIPVDENQWELSGVTSNFDSAITNAVSSGIDDLSAQLVTTQTDTVSTNQIGVIKLGGVDYNFHLTMSVKLNHFALDAETKKYTYSNLRLNFSFSYDGYTKNCKINDRTIKDGIYTDFQDGGHDQGNIASTAQDILTTYMRPLLIRALNFVAKHLLEHQIKPITVSRGMQGSQKIKLAKQLIKLAKELIKNC